MTAPDILVLYAHPAPQRSPVNRRLAEAARAIPGVALQDLYELYPDFDIDAAHERRLLEAAQLVVLLHPIRWYGMPSLLKEWMDVVLRPGWAYGKSEGERALRGKSCWLVTSTGSGPEAYGPDGMHGHPFDAFLLPIRQIAVLCGMDWLAPLVLHGTVDAGAAVIDAHVQEFRRRLAAYADTAASNAANKAAGSAAGNQAATEARHGA
jgi:glutathione-regulated potassium-efflux system ancillary protein KefF